MLITPRLPSESAGSRRRNELGERRNANTKHHDMSIELAPASGFRCSPDRIAARRLSRRTQRSPGCARRCDQLGQLPVPRCLLVRPWSSRIYCPLQWPRRRICPFSRPTLDWICRPPIRRVLRQVGEPAPRHRARCGQGDLEAVPWAVGTSGPRSELGCRPVLGVMRRGGGNRDP